MFPKLHIRQRLHQNFMKENEKKEIVLQDISQFLLKLLLTIYTIIFIQEIFMFVQNKIT